MCTEFLLSCCRPRKGRFSMETGRFWPICPFGARNGQICSEFLLLCRRPRKGRFSMETGRFWPICLSGARNNQICIEFLLLCCRPRKGRFSMETGRFCWPIYLPFEEPKMVKCAPNFCYCAVDQEKAVFQWKQAVSAGPSICPLRSPKWSNLQRISAIVL